MHKLSITGSEAYIFVYELKILLFRKYEKRKGRGEDRRGRGRGEDTRENVEERERRQERGGER